ncbi:hypothetical protein K439DRAFT_1630886, partial [Ramaria rubella]
YLPYSCHQHTNLWHLAACCCPHTIHSSLPVHTNRWVLHPTTSWSCASHLTHAHLLTSAGPRQPQASGCASAPGLIGSSPSS